MRALFRRPGGGAVSDLQAVLPHPGQQALVIHGPGGDGKSRVDHIFVGAVHVDAVDLQEGQHDIHADALVAVHEGVVGDQAVAQPGGLLLLGGVEFYADEFRKRRFRFRSS